MPPIKLDAKERARKAFSTEILKAAEKVLAESGYAQASMAAVAAAAGVSVGSLYNYFTDKTKLFQTLHEVRREEFLAVVDEVLATSDPFLEKLEQLTRTILQYFDANRIGLRNNLYNERPPVHSPRKKATPSILEFMERLKPFMQEGVAAGVLASRYVDLHASVYTGILRGILAGKIDDSSTRFSNLTHEFIDIFLKGVGCVNPARS